MPEYKSGEPFTTIPQAVSHLACLYGVSLEKLVNGHFCFFHYDWDLVKNGHYIKIILFCAKSKFCVRKFRFLYMGRQTN